MSTTTKLIVLVPFDRDGEGELRPAFASMSRPAKYSRPHQERHLQATRRPNFAALSWIAQGECKVAPRQDALYAPPETVGFLMPAAQPNVWGGGDAYERYMGRWSRKVAPLFTNWIGASPGASWIDVGCGTGVLTSVVLGTCEPSRVTGIDSSQNFLDVAETLVRDSRASFKRGDAQAIPEADDTFDVVASGLVLNFVPDKDAMIREMVRVAKPGGTVALYVWDYAGHMQLMRHFFDVATMLDPRARDFDDGVKAPICRPGPLTALLVRAGLANVEVQAMDIPTAFENFDDYWTPFLGGTGSAPKYCISLDEETRQHLREEVRRRLPTGPDGEILLAARAWAAKGRVAG